MPASAAPSENTATTLPRPSVNGSSPALPGPVLPGPVLPAPVLPAPAPPAAPARPAEAPPTPPPTPPTPSRHTRIASIRIALIAGFGALILLVIFIAQNTRATRVSFLGAHAVMSLALALLISAIAGALLMAAAGTARITQLRFTMRRLARRPGRDDR